MQTYLQSLLFSQQNNIPTTQQIDKVLKDLTNDNKQIENQLEEYERKISQLPLDIRRKIQQQRYLPEELSGNAELVRKGANVGAKQEEISSPQSPSIFTSIVDRNLLQQKLKNLEQEQQQIDYISRLSDMYIRCKKQPQSIITLEGDDLNQKDQQSSFHKLNQQKSTLERQELQEMAEFIRSIKPYRITKDVQNIDQAHHYQITNDLISNMKVHTQKKLTEKCQNLVHYGPSGNSDKVFIEKFLIKNCKSIILGEKIQNESKRVDKQSNYERIIGRFLEKILGDVIYYDVSYQKIILMKVIQPQISSSDHHQQTIHRKKIYFFPSETQKHFEEIKQTLLQHLLKAKDLKSLLSSNHHPNFSLKFDKLLQRQVSTIKSNLEYILPYINIKSRKVLMEILADGKDEVIDFEDLVLRLKFKGQDGEMFMNNLDAVFARLLDIQKLEDRKEDDQQKQQREPIIFNDKNFQTLTSFFELGIFQAEQSLLETSSKAIKKFTTNLASLHNREKASLPSKHTSKKLFNMIFFSVSNLVQKFDELLDKESDKFCQYSRSLEMTYEEKVGQWADKLIEIRENVRKRIHEE